MSIDWGITRRAGLVVTMVALMACTSPNQEAPNAVDAGSWAVTVWGRSYEIFAESDLLVAGETAASHTHVTQFDGFTPLVEGTVEIVLSGSSGEHVFASEGPKRPGIFSIEIEPPSPGEYDLAFRVRGVGGTEEIRGGRVRVGSAGQAGGLIVAPVPKGATNGGEPLDFLKEEQWRSDFSTAWVRSGRLARSVSGLARIRPPAGGEVTLTAPVDGRLLPASGSHPWPFEGLKVDRGQTLFRVVPRVSSERSLAELEANQTTLAAELGAARGRLSRLEELLELEAASLREVGAARMRVQTIEARHSAATRDLDTARSSRQSAGGSGAANTSLGVTAPFSGEVALVSATPGGTVEAGDILARVVRTDAVWIDIAVSPGDVRHVTADGARGVVLSDPELGPTRLEDGVRLVSVAPEMSPETGTVKVILEAPAGDGFILGTTQEAQVLLDRELGGIVVPARALVDDGGVSVVYLQLSGESFIRQEVRVLERQGDRVLVDRLVPGQRLVVEGGEAIRRSSLMATGAGHGHVH